MAEKRSMEAIVEEILAEEENCNEHTLPVTVRYICDPKTTKRRVDIVAALLRVLADYTDGHCATRAALNDDLYRTGMVFHFTDDKKRELFRKRIRIYLERSIVDCLAVT